MRYLAHAGIHINPHPPETVLYVAIGCAVVALVAIVEIRWPRRMRNILRAFVTGYRDGWEQPFDLTMGMTYKQPWLQSAWDYGCNIGQFVGARIKK